VTGKLVGYDKESFDHLGDLIKNSSVHGLNRSLGALALRLNALVHQEQLAERAVGKESCGRMKQLVFDSSDINAKTSSKLTPLHVVAKRGDWQLLQTLIDANADVDAVDNDGKSALQMTKCLRCEQVLKLSGADGWTPLMIASEEGNMDVVRKLLENPDHVKISNRYGFTPLHAAAYRGNIRVMQALIGAKADISAEDSKGRTPCDVADSLINIRKFHEHPLMEVKNHYHHACDICNQQLVEGCGYACKDCSFDLCMKCFTVEGSCRLQLQSLCADGWSPLMLAAERGKDAFEKYLQSREALVCIKDRAEFPSWVDVLVRYNMSMKELDWTWGTYESSSMSITQAGRKVRKTNSSPDYSSAISSYAFEEGMIHTWAVRVNKVQCMWLGIAGNVDCENGLSTYPSSATGEFVLAFRSNDGSETIFEGKGAKPIFEMGSGVEFGSNQVIEFELDLVSNTLNVRVDGTLKFIAKNVEGKGAHAYVCMDYGETATLLYTRSHIPETTWDTGAITDSERKVAFDNSAFERDTNLALLRHPNAGAWNLI
jgi:hypothetical protein